MSEDQQYQRIITVLRAATPEPPHEAEARVTFVAEAQRLKNAQPVSAQPDVRPSLWRLFSIHKDVPKGSVSMNRTHRRWGVPTLVVLVSVLVVGVVFGQDINNFFTRLSSNSNQTVIYYDTTPERVYYPTPVPLTLQDGVAQADFKVLVPAFIPNAYQFDNAIYNVQNHSLFLEYRCSQGMVRRFGLVQTVMPEPSNPFKTDEVGASAIIEDVQIGKAHGQYVRGAWRVVGFESLANQHPAPKTPISTTEIWDNNSEFQHLVWYQKGVSYRLMTTAGSLSDDDTSGVCKLSKEDYLTVAKSLAPAN